MNTVDQAAPSVRTIRLTPRSALELRGATVIDRQGNATQANVVIEGERIAAVGADAGAGGAEREVVDVAGRWIIPGLIDGHIHLAAGGPSTREPDAFEQRDAGVALLEASLHYGRMLLSGVTTVRSLGGEPAETAAAIRRGMLDEFLAGPRILTAGTAVVLQSARNPTERLVAAIKVARRNFGSYADVVMLGSCQQSTRPPFDARELAELVDEAHRRHIRIALKPASAVEAIAASNAGIDSIEGLPADADDALIRTLAANGTALTSLLAGETDHTRRDLVGQAFQRDVRIVAGSDWSLPHPERTLKHELAALAGLGLEPVDVLAAATSHAADALGLGEWVGEIAAGKLAELVVLRSDPRTDASVLADAAHVELVLQAGDPLTS